MRISRISKTVTSVVMAAVIASSNLSLFAQARRPGQVAAKKPIAAAKCSGAWTGVITYKRTQGKSETKRVERVSMRGHDTRKWEMRYSYTARVAVVESPDGNGSSDGKASVEHSFTSNETVDAVELNSCDRGKTWKEMKGTSKSEVKTTGSGRTEANVTIGVNDDGTYSVSVGIPQIKGQTSGSQSSEFSGQCTKKEGKSLTMPPTETTIEGNSLTSSGVHKIDPADPNKISGSFTNTWQDVTETIEWNLQRCGAPLRLIDVKFEDMKFPDWNAWQEITEQKGTTDGNLVKIKATVLNASGEEKYGDIRFKETYKGDKWDGARPDQPLDDSVVSVKVPPGEEKEVELIWDSSGYAWYDDGRPRLVQRIKAELETNGKKIDEKTQNLKVAPKPLVLVHGLWSNWKAWESWQNILTTSHSYDWKAFPVGEKPEHGRMNTGGEFMSTDPTNTIGQNAEELKRYIDYAQRDRNAWHVDLVAHSMGGLISRDYIDRLMPAASQDGRPQVSHLVMLGTPNMGSPCADIMNPAFEVLGKKVEAVRQLRQDVAAEFNKLTRNRKGVRFSALAGEVLPTICYANEWNDGVVTVPSAIWEVKDNARSKNVHTDLTGTADFSSFVKPRLAVGPKGDHTPDVQIPAGMASVYGKIAHRHYGASGFAAETFDGSIQRPAPWAKEVVIGGKSYVDVELPVSAGTNLGVVFMAGSDVSVTLFDDRGNKVADDRAGSPASRAWFRSFAVNRPVTAGVWKLRFENTGEREMTAVATSSQF
ncbi:MAG: lipase family alpha/beta hydrolase [Pyrinomonadaceae bacterium]